MSASVPHNEWIADTTTPAPVRLLRLGDERLAWLAARGSTRAFAAVYERYHQSLYRYCRSILRDEADAQDALQSTFTRALSALKRDQRSAPLRPWLFRIAHNESISVLRRRRGGGSDSPEAAPVPLAPSAEDQAGERARLAMLMDDLAALPDRARNALVMRELSGLSHEDIAIALEISEGAAKQAIFEARRGLHECAEGRAMLCAEVCRAISDGDRRVLRGRRVRAHLRDCESCSAFAASIGGRRAELRGLVPALPAAASAAVLARVIKGGAAHAGAAGGGVAAAGTAGKTVGIAVGGKGFAAASLLATAAVSVGGVATVVRLAHDGRPSVPVGGGHAAVASPAARAARARSGATESYTTTLQAPGPPRSVPGNRATAAVKLPVPAASARHGHGGSSRPGWSHGRSGISHGQSRGSHGQSGLSHGQAGLSHGQSMSSHGQSALLHGQFGSSHGQSVSSHGQSGSSHGQSVSSQGKGHANTASHGQGTGKQTARGQVKASAGVLEQYSAVHAQPNRSLAVGHQVGTNVPGSQPLTSGKAHK